MSVPKPRHGQICGNAYFFIRSRVDTADLGHVLSNDSAVITERGPDTVRGADLAFYGYARVPKGPLPEGHLPVVPELVVKVVSPTDRWPEVLAKVAEYLKAAISAVIVLDGERNTAMVFRDNGTTQTLSADEDLTLPDILPGLSIAVRRFFA